MVVFLVNLSSKHKKNNKLRWLASDINFKLLHTGCPIAHDATEIEIIWGKLEMEERQIENEAQSKTLERQELTETLETLGPKGLTETLAPKGRIETLETK